MRGTSRYLEVDFKASRYDTSEHDIIRALTNITRAPLKPQQQLEVIRVHLIPRLSETSPLSIPQAGLGSRRRPMRRPSPILAHS